MNTEVAGEKTGLGSEKTAYVINMDWCIYRQKKQGVHSVRCPCEGYRYAIEIIPSLDTICANTVYVNDKRFVVKRKRKIRPVWGYAVADWSDVVVIFTSILKAWG